MNSRPSRALAKCEVLVVGEVAENAIPVLADANRHCAGHGCGGRSRAFRVREDVQIRERHRLDELARLFEQLIRLAGKSDHDIGADCRVRHQLPGLRQAIRIMARPVLAMHLAQDRVRARLQRRVYVLRNARRLRHEAEQVVGKIHRLDGTQANALDAGFVEQAAQQIGKPHRAAGFPSPSPQIDAR